MCRSNAWLAFAKKNKSNTWTMKSYVLKCVECISFLVQHSQNQFILKKSKLFIDNDHVCFLAVFFASAVLHLWHITC